MRRHKFLSAEKSLSDAFPLSFVQPDHDARGAQDRTGPLVQTSQVLGVFLDTLAREERPAILDLGRVMGDNIQFFCGLGFKVYAFDLLQTLELKAADGREDGEDSDPCENKFYEEAVGAFNYPDGSLAGVLCWDILDHLEFKLAYALLQRIQRSMRAGGLLHSFFNMRRTNGAPAGQGYRVLDREHVVFLPGVTRPSPRHIHQNREIMKLFTDFKILHFYFLRNNFRELLVQNPVNPE